MSAGPKPNTGPNQAITETITTHCLCDGLLLDKVKEKRKNGKWSILVDGFIVENWEKKRFCVTNGQRAGNVTLIKKI